MYVEHDLGTDKKSPEKYPYSFSCSRYMKKKIIQYHSKYWNLSFVTKMAKIKNHSKMIFFMKLYQNECIYAKETKLAQNWTFQWIQNGGSLNTHVLRRSKYWHFLFSSIYLTDSITDTEACMVHSCYVFARIVWDCFNVYRWTVTYW